MRLSIDDLMRFCDPTDHRLICTEPFVLDDEHHPDDPFVLATNGHIAALVRRSSVKEGDTIATLPNDDKTPVIKNMLSGLCGRASDYRDDYRFGVPPMAACRYCVDFDPTEDSCPACNNTLRRDAQSAKADTRRSLLVRLNGGTFVHPAYYELAADLFANSTVSALLPPNDENAADELLEAGCLFDDGEVTVFLMPVSLGRLDPLDIANYWDADAVKWVKSPRGDDTEDSSSWVVHSGDALCPKEAAECEAFWVCFKDNTIEFVSQGESEDWNWELVTHYIPVRIERPSLPGSEVVA